MPWIDVADIYRVDAIQQHRGQHPRPEETRALVWKCKRGSSHAERPSAGRSRKPVWMQTPPRNTRPCPVRRKQAYDPRAYEDSSRCVLRVSLVVGNREARGTRSLGPRDPISPEREGKARRKRRLCRIANRLSDTRQRDFILHWKRVDDDGGTGGVDQTGEKKEGIELLNGQKTSRLMNTLICERTPIRCGGVERTNPRHLHNSMAPAISTCKPEHPHRVALLP